MQKLKRGIDSFLFSPLDARPVAVFRVVLGVWMCLWTLASFQNWKRDFAADGMLPLADLNLTANVSAGWLFSILHIVTEAVPSYLLWAIVLVASILFTLGWQTRAFTLLLLFIHNCLWIRNPLVANSVQAMFRMFLFYGIFLPLGGHFSLDARKTPKQSYFTWPLRSIQLHLCWIYLLTCAWKIISDLAWLNGDALYYVMIQSTWSRWPYPELFYYPGTSALLTYFTLFLEGFAPFLFWVPRLRLPFVITTILFHLVLAFVMQFIGFFTVSMSIGLLLFLNWSDYQKLGSFFHTKKVSHVTTD